MEQIGLYSQITEFTNDNAGTAEWCKAERDGHVYFIKRFQSPVYPSEEINLPEKKKRDKIKRFHSVIEEKKTIYQRLQESDSRGTLVIPFEVMNYQYHICTVADFVEGNIKAEEVCRLSEWQRLVLMRTLTLAVMKIHKAGIVHSDLKPDNVIIKQDGEGNCKIKLIDFDGSFFASLPPENADNVTGDPAYFAPEVLRFCSEESICLDHRMDIFALGLILHYFWSGKLPEKPADQTAAEYLLRGGHLVLDETLPLALQKTLQRMLATDPSERIDMNTVYSVLGAQISLHCREIVKIIDTEESEYRPKRYTVEGDEHKKTGNESEYRFVRKAKPSETILVKKEKTKWDRRLNVLLAAACILLFFSVSKAAGVFEKSASLFSSYYHTEAQTTEIPVKTPAPAVSPASSQIVPSAARAFSIFDISTQKGKTTIHWEDSLDAGPYIVSCKYAGDGSAKQASFYAEKNEKNSTTHFKYFKTNRLIPGEKYIIEVTDSFGTEITTDYFVPWEGVYSEGQLSAASVEVSAKKMYDSPSGDGELATFHADTMSVNMENGYSFGLYYKIEIPDLLSKRSYLTQILMKGPNGFALTVYADKETYEPDVEYCWSCLGSYFFDRIKYYYGSIPGGDYTVDLFFDGMWVNMLTFSIM